MRNKLVCTLFFIFIFYQSAIADDFISSYITNGQKVGEGRFSVLFWEVYDVKLFGPNGEWVTNKPFALSIQYLRHIEGKDLAARSVEEMRKQGLKDEKILTGWYNTLKNIFPDVENGSVLTAVFVPGQHTKFFSNDQEIGIVEGDEFLNWFSGIWLSEKTSEPELRQQLIGHS